jgi:hypothetical protein
MKKRTNRRKSKTKAWLHKPKRKLGFYGPTITIADDFDGPLPQEILDAFEGMAEEKRSKPSSKSKQRSRILPRPLSEKSCGHCATH